MLFFLSSLFAAAWACGTTQYTSTIGAEVTDIIISADFGVQLSVSIDANDSNLQALVSFHGKSLASSVVGTSTDDSTFSLHIQASEPTDPPSSANSMIFFSGASTTIADFALAALSLSATAQAQCLDEATVTLSIPSAWEIVSESTSSVSLRYNPRQWGFKFTLIMSNRTLDNWTAADEAALFDALAAFLGLGSYEVLLTFMSDGGLSVTILVSGYTSEADATSGYQSMSGLSLNAHQFGNTTMTAEAPAFACRVGFSATSDGLCVDTDGCETNSCNSQVTGNICVDVPAPGVKYTCDCSNDGLFDNQALAQPVCQDVDGCADNTCGHGDCVDAIQPETGYSCDCNVGYSDANRTCVDTAGCQGYLGSCSDGGDVGGNCLDIAAPGTGYTCICSAGYNIDLTACVIQDCGTPSVPTGYTLASGLTTYGTSRVLTCATGYAGSPSPLVCAANSNQDSGARGVWTSISGCAAQSCPVSPTQIGYIIASGSSTYGSTRTVTCEVGYTGTASQVTCQSNLSWSVSSGCSIRDCGAPGAITGYVFASGATTYGSSLTSSCATGYTGSGTSITCSSSASWSSPSGCTIVSCPSSPTQTGYTIAAGASTYGSTRTVTCATGYTGTASSITCQASAAWTAASGCALVNCGTPVAGAGYALGSGGTTYGSTYTMTCATGYTGAASSISCQSSGAWSNSSGCSVVTCSTNPTQTGYTFASGASTYGATRTASCASGYSGSGSAISCQSSGSWTSSSGCTYQATSCQAIKTAAPSSPSGTYTVTLPGASSPITVWCDMNTAGGGWTLVGQSWAASGPDTSSGVRNLYNFRDGGGTWNRGLRGQHTWSIPNLAPVARASTRMLIARWNNPVDSVGDIAAATAAAYFAIPNPSTVNFACHSWTWTGGSSSETGPCVPVTVYSLKSDSCTNGCTRYTFQNSLGTTWTDGYPTSYGAGPNSYCYNDQSYGPAVTSDDTGLGNSRYNGYWGMADASRAPGSMYYWYYGLWDVDSTGYSGLGTVWLK